MGLGHRLNRGAPRLASCGEAAAGGRDVAVAGEVANDLDVCASVQEASSVMGSSSSGTSRSGTRVTGSLEKSRAEDTVFYDNKSITNEGNGFAEEPASPTSTYRRNTAPQN
jgi:hypothetical protein